MLARRLVGALDRHQVVCFRSDRSGTDVGVLAAVESASVVRPITLENAPPPDIRSVPCQSPGLREWQSGQQSRSAIPARNPDGVSAYRTQGRGKVRR
jgi:hypothetical protein